MLNLQIEIKIKSNIEYERNQHNNVYFLKWCQKKKSMFELHFKFK